MSRTRILGFAAVAALAAAVAMPSPASASRKAHLLKLYKVEQHVDLEGQDETYTVQCPMNGIKRDLALDGMYRIDDVAQDPDYFGDEISGGSWSTNSFTLDHTDWDLLRSVRPIEVTRTDSSTYDFKFTPLAGGDVSMKLWITCLGWQTEPNSHTVSWKIDPPNGVASDYNINLDDSAMPGSAEFTVPPTSNSTAGACPLGSIVVQPSYTVNSGDAELAASYPSANGTRWTWQFVNPTPGFTATVTWRCLALRSSLASDGSGHRHRIVRNMSSIYSPANGKFKPNGVSEVQRNCGEHYKGMIGGWDYFSNGKYGFRKLWYLGMDPRIKTRAFKFLSGYGTAEDTPLYLVCFKDKTT